ncbi:MAG: hypothetical protein IKI09_12840 [Bacteroidales bacterium]|nr:hypothetical protein [Bacteroidales bacterium]
MATTQTKKINWLFPDPNVEVTEEDIFGRNQKGRKIGKYDFRRVQPKAFAMVGRKQNQIIEK